MNVPFKNLIIFSGRAAGCGAVCTRLLCWASLRLNKRRYPVLSVKTTLLRMMDSNSIGRIMLSKEEKSSFILKQQRQLQLQLWSARPPAPLLRAVVLEHWALKPRLNAFRLEVYLTYSCPHQTQSHTNAHTHTYCMCVCALVWGWGWYAHR